MKLPRKLPTVSGICVFSILRRHFWRALKSPSRRFSPRCRTPTALPILLPSRSLEAASIYHYTPRLSTCGQLPHTLALSIAAP